uniref:OTU domain-containing protein n=1 Tax=Panagrolaimus sp. PS1159 TaxID=55785 RepID=A0AC35ESL4_9BILA
METSELTNYCASIYSLLYVATTNVRLYPFDWEIWQMKQKKRKEKFEKVKNVSSFTWEIKESRLNEMDFSPGACETTTYKYIGEKKEIKYFVELFPRGIPNTKYQYGSWIILKLFNNTLDTNVEAKYTVKIPSANYTKKCQHIFEKNEEWEMNGLKMCELFNPKKKYIFNGSMNFKFEFEFTEFEKESVEKVDFSEDVSEEKTVWTFPLTWDIPLKQLKAKFKPHECINSTNYFVQNQFKFFFKIFPNLPGYSIEKGAWIFLYFKNLNEETFIETKYIVSVEKAKYQRESRHFFKQFNQWETHRNKIDELFDKKLLSQKEEYIQIKFKISFAKDIKEDQDENDQIEDFSVHEFDNLTFLSESSEADDNETLLTSEAALTAKDIYFPPTDSWLINQCNLMGIQFYKNISKFRPPIDDIQKFTILKPTDVIHVEGDGKCGYRALSVLLCGNDCYHLCIKRMICKMIRDNMDPKFEEMYIFKDARQNAARKLMFDPETASDERFWMDDSDLAAAANLFDCNIFVFTLRKEWQCFGPKTFENGIMDSFVNFDSNLPTLLLENSGGNHFSPVKNVRLNWW